MKVETTESFEGSQLFWYISTPKKEVFDETGTLLPQRYETIYVVYNYRSDLVMNIVDTDKIAVPDNTPPSFGSGNNLIELELI